LPAVAARAAVQPAVAAVAVAAPFSFTNAFE